MYIYVYIYVYIHIRICKCEEINTHRWELTGERREGGEERGRHELARHFRALVEHERAEHLHHIVKITTHLYHVNYVNENYYTHGLYQSL